MDKIIKELNRLKEHYLDREIANEDKDTENYYYFKGKREGITKVLSIIEGGEKETSVLSGIISESEANGVCPLCKGEKWIITDGGKTSSPCPSDYHRVDER